MDFDDWLAFEMCGGFGEDRDVVCPHCQTALSVHADEPEGRESYSCSSCGGLFVVDWDTPAS